MLKEPVPTVGATSPTRTSVGTCRTKKLLGQEPQVRGDGRQACEHFRPSSLNTIDEAKTQTHIFLSQGLALQAGHGHRPQRRCSWAHAAQDRLCQTL